MITEDNDSWISYECQSVGVGYGDEFVITTHSPSHFNGNQVIKAKIKLIGTIANRCHFEVLSYHHGF